MEKKKERIISFVRIGIYVLVVLYAVLMEKNVYMGADICPIHRIFGVLCSTCGATRAALSLMHLDVKAALDYNPIYTLGVFPMAAILVLEDVFTVIRREMTKKYRQSIAERVYVWFTA